jgi:hypothetical protein
VRAPLMAEPHKPPFLIQGYGLADPPKAVALPVLEVRSGHSAGLGFRKAKVYIGIIYW